MCFLSGANNLVPIEIALKTATKIKVNQRFSAYIVLPMWPEGKPTGHIAQRILYWQVRLGTFICAMLLVYSLWSISVHLYCGIANFRSSSGIVEQNNANDVRDNI